MRRVHWIFQQFQRTPSRFILNPRTLGRIFTPSGLARSKVVSFFPPASCLVIQLQEPLAFRAARSYTFDGLLTLPRGTTLRAAALPFSSRSRKMISGITRDLNDEDESKNERRETRDERAYRLVTLYLSNWAERGAKFAGAVPSRIGRPSNVQSFVSTSASVIAMDKRISRLTSSPTRARMRRVFVDRTSRRYPRSLSVIREANVKIVKGKVVRREVTMVDLK